MAVITMLEQPRQHDTLNAIFAENASIVNKTNVAENDKEANK